MTSAPSQIELAFLWSETVQAIVIILQSKARKFRELPYEQRRDAVPVAPEGVGIS